MDAAVVAPVDASATGARWRELVVLQPGPAGDASGDAGDGGYAHSVRLAVNAHGSVVGIWSGPDTVSQAAESIWSARYELDAGWGQPEALEALPASTRAQRVALDDQGNAVALWAELFKQQGGSYPGAETPRLWTSRYEHDGGWREPVRLSTASIDARYGDGGQYGEDGFVVSGLHMAPDGKAVAIGAQTQYLSGNIPGSIDTSVWTATYEPVGGWQPAQTLFKRWTSLAPRMSVSAAGEVLGFCLSDLGSFASAHIEFSRFSFVNGWSEADTWEMSPKVTHPYNVLAHGPVGEHDALVLFSANDSPDPWTIWAARFRQDTGWESPVALFQQPPDYGLRTYRIRRTGEVDVFWAEGPPLETEALYTKHYKPDTGWSADLPLPGKPFGRVSAGTIGQGAHGETFLLWQAGRPGGAFELWTARRSPAGLWETPVMLDADALGASLASRPPDEDPETRRIVIDPDGRATVVWIGADHSVRARRFE